VEKLVDEHHIEAAFRPQKRSGQIVFEARSLAKYYGEKALFKSLDLTVTFGQRIGVVGPNGAGKTTLLRILLGLEPPTAGALRAGAGVAPAYLAQEQESLSQENTVLEEILRADPLDQTEARTLLACFLFREEDVFKQVRQLSIGERVRLALARAMVTRANLMVLDEPTNHLDIDSRERMEEALAGYTGTLLVASHDRYLLDRLADTLLIFEAGRVLHFPGRYSEWEERRGRG